VGKKKKSEIESDVLDEVHEIPKDDVGYEFVGGKLEQKEIENKIELPNGLKKFDKFKGKK
jgi:hypothetical protein